MRAGVTVVDPATTWIDADVELEPDVTLLPGRRSCTARTGVALGRARSGPNGTLTDTVVGEGAVGRPTPRADAPRSAPGATVGPYTYLRPGTLLGRATPRSAPSSRSRTRIVGEGSKVPHLSYVGDAEIGEGTNIGAATVFVNYDGVDKHRTVVGDHVRIGSDTMLVAPVTIGDGAYTAAGSVITEDVPPGAMAVARARQRNIEGWVARKRPGPRPTTPPGGRSDEALDGGTSDAADTAQSGQDEPTTEHEGQAA